MTSACAIEASLDLETSRLLEAAAAKREALDLIMNHYAEGTFDYPDASVHRISIFQIEIDTMTGKTSP